MQIIYQKILRKEEKDFYMQIERDANFFKISCLSKDEEEMGYATFKIYKNYLWIYKIETHSNFQHQGVATAIIDVAEYIAIKKGVNRVEGKFMTSNQFARSFYEKNGYYVPNKEKFWKDYDPFGILYKNLDATTIKEKIANRIEVQKESSLVL